VKKILLLMVLGTSAIYLMAMENGITPVQPNDTQLPPPPYILKRQNATVELSPLTPPALDTAKQEDEPQEAACDCCVKEQDKCPAICNPCIAVNRMAYYNFCKKRNAISPSSNTMQ
jgi:hypothetical protein